MKKIVISSLVAGAVFALAACSFGQAAGPKGGVKTSPGQQKPGQNQRRGARMDQQILAKLNLTAAQKKQVAALAKTMQAKQKALREKMQNSTDRTKMRSEMMAMRKSYGDSLKKILTAAQWTKYEALRKEMMEKMRKEFGNRRPGSPPPGASANAAKKGKGGF